MPYRFPTWVNGTADARRAEEHRRRDLVPVLGPDDRGAPGTATCAAGAQPGRLRPEPARARVPAARRAPTARERRGRDSSSSSTAATTAASARRAATTRRSSSSTSRTSSCGRSRRRRRRILLRPDRRRPRRARSPHADRPRRRSRRATTHCDDDARAVDQRQRRRRRAAATTRYDQFVRAAARRARRRRLRRARAPGVVAPQLRRRRVPHAGAPRARRPVRGQLDRPLARLRNGQGRRCTSPRAARGSSRMADALPGARTRAQAQAKCLQRRLGAAPRESGAGPAWRCSRSTGPLPPTRNFDSRPARPPGRSSGQTRHVLTRGQPASVRSYRRALSAAGRGAMMR